ncbi:MAG: BamA/TamA family outer membrane protein, partial [Thermoanaerobaculia bacterium]|nr:BamA/TamA family outer membrane protein [Thermoanaerobaculia bacterium]
IAVAVASPLLGAKDVQSAPSIASQALSLALEQRNVESRGEADILIRPELGKLSPLDFGQVVETMPLGWEATLEVANRLAGLADPQVSPALYSLHRRSAMPLPVVESIGISGVTRVDVQRIRQRIHTRIGEVVDLEVLRDDLARVFSIGEFSSVRFAFEEPPAEGRLIIRVEDKDWGPNYLRLGLGFSDDLEGSNGLSARLNYTMTNLNRYGGEWRNEIQTGRTRGLLTEFFQPLDYREHFFIAPRAVSRQVVHDIYVDRTKIAEYKVETHSLGLDFGLEFGKYGEFRLGLQRGIARADSRIGDPGFPESDVETGGLVGRLVIDRLDSSGVPLRGTLADVSLFVSEGSLGADDTYQKLDGRTSTYFTHGRHTGFVGLSAGSSLGSDTPAYDAFLVGGLFSFSGYSIGELRGNYYAVARGGYFYRLYDLPVAFGTAIYAGGWIEGGNVWQDSSDIALDDPLSSITLALAIETRFGPVYLAHGLAEDGGSQFYFRLGNSF